MKVGNPVLQRVRRALSPALLVLGIVLVGYVGAQYAHMYAEQRHLAQQWQKQQVQSQKPHEQLTPASASKVEDDGLTRLSVPKIGLDSVVVQGTSYKALLVGPGHMTDTPAPGDEGNSVITGHRDTFFRHIHELDKGDTLLVQRDGKIFKYEVTGKKVVEPEDLSVLRPAKDHRLTLITCYPTYYLGPAPKRLVVFSKMIDEAAEGKGGGK